MSLEILYHIKYPPNGYYSPQYPVTHGTDKTFKNVTKSTDELYIKIKVLNKCDKVDKIDIIFSGEIRITYKDDSIPEPFDNGVELLTEKLSLFNFTQTLFDKHNSTFEKDEILILKYKEFKFPFDKFRLPSSYEFSCPTWKLSIEYGLALVLKSSTNSFPGLCDASWKLNYQSGNYFGLDRNLNYLVSDTSLKDTESHCFKKKTKRFILDKGANSVANILNGSHWHTRIFRSMFNDNYKKSTYEDLTKDVDLTLKLKPNSYSFDITDNFVSQLGVLRIETSSILNNILEPDYEINKTSTELGKFHFKYLKIYMIDHLNIHCKGHSSGPLLKKTALIDTLVYKRQHETVSPKFINGYNNNNTDDMNDINDAKSNNSSINTADTSNIDSDNNDVSISFDLCNFKQDPQNKECYFTELNISELLKNSSSSVSFPKPILSSFTMPNHFENDASIEIEIGIDSRFKGEAETKIYNFSFGVILTSNLRLPPKVNRYRKKNQYSNDYVTATSKNNSQDQCINNKSYNNTNDVVPQSQPLSNPPQYNDIFDSSEIGNESSNRSTAHVAKQ
ncbi:hypothetical protein B5S30_g5635 [[Candida] boidinii]|nr:hypothetical protein B5S30_g5635 [[Candida] boidinii]